MAVYMRDRIQVNDAFRQIVNTLADPVVIVAREITHDSGYDLHP